MKAHKRWLAVAALAVGLVPEASGAVPAEVAEVVSACELRLVDGTLVVLAGIVVAPGSVAAATARLAALAQGPAELLPEPPRFDRHGARRAQVRFAKAWAQGELVARGLAAVAPAPDVSDDDLEALLALEAAARAARQGVWRSSTFGPEPAARVAAEPVRFMLVEGRILAVGRGRDDLYLNFGTDRWTDFTVRILAADLRGMVRQGFAPEALAGRRVRVRGWLFPADGAMIEVTHRAQIEVVE